jgi:phosphoribosyl 1,2-cyclic phosphate phosphodiesterase
MKITLLGTGTSTGVPQIGCTCAVCTSKNKKDVRMRASALIEIKGVNLLIDCGPDFRMQVLNRPFERLHAVLLTHEHYDHVGGLDDLRPYCAQGDIPIYANQRTCDQLMQRMPYCFTSHKYPGVPNISLHALTPTEKVMIEEVEIIPIPIMHAKMPILGYRIGKFAYLTDVLYLPDEAYPLLKGVECLVINALRRTAHLSHQTLEEALKNIQRINPQQAYLTHISHHMGLHDDINAQLPTNVQLGYDGQVIVVS